MCVVRRRRDEAADAPSSGSRVSPLLVHHAAPADGEPRCCCPAFFPRPSVVKQRMMKRKTPHLAPGAGGAYVTAPFPVVESSTLLRMASTVGICAVPAQFLERPITRRALL